MFRFDSDVNLANPSTASGEAFTEFSKDRGMLSETVYALCDDLTRFSAAWATAYQDSMYKLSVLGVSEETKQGFKDCTGILGQAISVTSDSAE